VGWGSSASSILTSEEPQHRAWSLLNSASHATPLEVMLYILPVSETRFLARRKSSTLLHLSVGMFALSEISVSFMGLCERADSISAAISRKHRFFLFTRLEERRGLNTFRVQRLKIFK